MSKAAAKVFRKLITFSVCSRLILSVKVLRSICIIERSDRLMKEIMQSDWTIHTQYSYTAQFWLKNSTYRISFKTEHKLSSTCNCWCSFINWCCSSQCMTKILLTKWLLWRKVWKPGRHHHVFGMIHGYNTNIWQSKSLRRSKPRLLQT